MRASPADQTDLELANELSRWIVTTLTTHGARIAVQASLHAVAVIGHSAGLTRERMLAGVAQAFDDVTARGTP